MFQRVVLLVVAAASLSIVTLETVVAKGPNPVYLGDLTAEQNFQVAMEAQTGRNYPAMLKHLRSSAEAGNLDAQEMLGLVLIVGPNLYGNSVKVNRCEAGM
jgi:hypothetical protein